MYMYGRCVGGARARKHIRMAGKRGGTQRESEKRDFSTPHDTGAIYFQQT